MFKIFTSIEEVADKWEEIEVPYFLQTNFLRIFYQTHKNIKHLFILNDNTRLYGQIFNLNFKKTKNYLIDRLSMSFLIRFLNLKVLFLTNSFITNVNSSVFKKKVCLDKILNMIEDKYSIVVIPEDTYDKISVKRKSFTKIEVEQEMVLDVKSSWVRLDDYMLDLRKRYRNKIKKIIERTNHIEVIHFSSTDLEKYTLEMQLLFNQIVKKSRFRGPEFNVDSFVLFVEKGFMQVYGYFLKDKLIGFSSEIVHEDSLYSYFVGFDKELNNSVPIYGRILLENIQHAIKLKKNRVILGRTANEYKSNFGAYPIKTFVYLKVVNKFLRFILRPVYKNITLRDWKKRRAFKN